MNKKLKKYYSNKKVLVTGGAGFIGSWLTEALVELEAKVIVVARPNSKLWRLNDISEKIKIYRANLENYSKIKKIITASRPDIIFNLAATVGGHQLADDFDRIFKNNVLTTVNLIKAAKNAKVDKFVQIGTILEYGDQASPFKEINRESAASPYSLSKIMATQAALFLGKSLDLKVIVVRPAATFGPRQDRGMLIPNLILSAIEKKDFKMNRGEQRRDLIFVWDLVEGLILSGMRDQTIGEIINLGSNRGFKMKKIADTVNLLMGQPIKIKYGSVPYRPLDTLSFFMSSDKAKKLLHWRAKKPISKALQITIDWYRNNYRLIK